MSKEALTEDLGTDSIYPRWEKTETDPNVNGICVATHTYSGGISKREYFAMAAMSGLAQIYPQGGDFMEQHIAEGAIKIADALLKELSK